MIEFLIIGIFYVILALLLFIRVGKGPTVVDRAVAGDCIEVLTTIALVSFAIFTGRSIYLDVALILAMLGFIGMLMIAKYLEDKL